MDITVIERQLADVEGEMAQLDTRRDDLAKAADDLRSAIVSLTAVSNGSGPAAGRARKTRKRKKKANRPKVTPADLTGALDALGGEATVEQLVEKLSLPDGRSLNGARRVAVEAGSVVYEDRTYKLSG